MSALVSIIIPCFNSEKYIEKCLLSVTHQTYENLEIIIVNDGSTDSSPVIFETYARIDNRIKVVNQPNRGLCAARNVGLDIASGLYIMHLDNDDYLNRTQEARDFFCIHPKNTTPPILVPLIFFTSILFDF
jgi:glycosyltransferase involved in cell wall biosynthesis